MLDPLISTPYQNLTSLLTINTQQIRILFRETFYMNMNNYSVILILNMCFLF